MYILCYHTLYRMPIDFELQGGAREGARERERAREERARELGGVGHARMRGREQDLVKMVYHMDKFQMVCHTPMRYAPHL